MAGVAHGRWSYCLNIQPDLSFGSSRQVCEELAPLLSALIKERLPAPSTAFVAPSEWDPAEIQRRAVEAMILVTLILVASGITVSLANAIATAITQGVLAARDMTADEVAAAIIGRGDDRGL